MVWLLQDADADDSFSDSECDAALESLRAARPRLLVYHMTRPLCEGKLWDVLRRGPFVDGNRQDPEGLVVVVHADDLRSHGVQLSYGLSWERTCQDFVEQLGSVGKLVSLVTCAHLVVLFGYDGVIYHRGWRAAKPLLFFEPLGVEGEFARRNSGSMPGAAETFVAGFAKGLVCSHDLSIEDGIVSGLWAVRRLARFGLALESPMHRAEVLMDDLGNREGDGSFLTFHIPSDEIVRGSDVQWSLIDRLIGDPAEVGRQIVKYGVDAVSGRVPMTRFNDFVVFDRQEIEAFRTLFKFLREYLSAPQNKPLNVLVCGPRGAGKAFAAVNVAQSASKGLERKVQELRFDLSQFTEPHDLISAFHSVRDCALEGSMPLVYFSGFDSTLAGTPLGWLPHLLSVTLGGKLSDHGVSRPIGPAVFFFGTTVFTSYDHLRQRASMTAIGTGIDTRHQDFLNCLHGVVNVLGSNQLDTGDGIDRLYPVRRAVVLRALLEQRDPNLTGGHANGMIDIDDEVLNSLLLAPHYRQGIRSLKSILALSRLNGCRSFERAALPPPSQLDIHVGYKDFKLCRHGPPLPGSIRERVAERLHNAYMEAKKVYIPDDVGDLKPWKELSEELKESSRAHADSIPYKLRLISCFLSETLEYREPVSEFTPDEIERLGEVEHDRWNSERLQKQWHQGERDPEKRTSPFLKPWQDIERKWQMVDCAMVASYPKIVEPYSIYRTGPQGRSA